MVEGMKAFRVDDRGKLRFLFNAFQGSSVVPLDRWIETKRPWGREGKGRKYRVAFHFLRDPDRIAAFNRLTKGKYVIIPIRASRVEPKRNSSVGSWLAKKIFVSSTDVRRICGETISGR